jgi:hypothetical protein
VDPAVMKPVTRRGSDIAVIAVILAVVLARMAHRDRRRQLRRGGPFAASRRPPLPGWAGPAGRRIAAGVTGTGGTQPGLR